MRIIVLSAFLACLAFAAATTTPTSIVPEADFMETRRVVVSTRALREYCDKTPKLQHSQLSGARRLMQYVGYDVMSVLTHDDLKFVDDVEESAMDQLDSSATDQNVGERSQAERVKILVKLGWTKTPGFNQFLYTAFLMALRAVNAEQCKSGSVVSTRDSIKSLLQQLHLPDCGDKTISHLMSLGIRNGHVKSVCVQSAASSKAPAGEVGGCSMEWDQLTDAGVQHCKHAALKAKKDAKKGRLKKD